MIVLEIIEFQPQQRQVRKPAVEANEWRNQAQIAMYFQVSPATVSRWVKKPENPLPRQVVDGVKRIDLNVAKKWFAGNGGIIND
jgi:hypothetical protein